jgi:hypothetical protein
MVQCPHIRLKDHGTQSHHTPTSSREKILSSLTDFPQNDIGIYNFLQACYILCSHIFALIALKVLGEEH